MKTKVFTALLVAGLAGSFGTALAGTASNAKPVAIAQPISLAEARRTVRLMNDIYVTAVLTTSKMYVQEPGTAAAVTWGKQVIREVNSRGGPQARIFTTADRPLNPENGAIDAFEREAGAAFVKGEAALEKVSSGRYRFAVPLRITDKSCLTCHVRNRVGDLLGGVSYSAVIQAITTPSPPGKRSKL